MFEYTQGYEIDGSDTSYSVLTPDKQKCIEILKYFLSLKTVNREKNFSIKGMKDKQKRYYETKHFKYEQLDEILQSINDLDIKQFEFSFFYINANDLYPEVKRELIDTISEIEGKKTPKLINPTFYNSYEVLEYVSIYLFDEGLNKNYYSMSFSSNEYDEKIKNQHFFSIDFNVRVGGAYHYHAYAISKLSKRFPELQVEVKDTVDYIIPYTTLSLNSYVGECIEIKSYDLEYTLNGITSNSIEKPFEIKLCNVTSNLEGVRNKNLEYEFSKAYDGTFKINSEWKSWYNEFDALQGIFKKNKLTVSEYATAVKKLAKVDLFSDAYFSYYTEFFFSVYSNSLEKINCKTRLIRNKENIKIYVIVPIGKYAQVKNILNA